MASKTKNIKNTNTYKKIKSNYILKEIFDNLSEKKLLKIIKVNKNIQKCLNKGLNDFKMFYEKIEIELELLKKPTYPNCFIHYQKKYENYFHIYFDNDMKKEVKKNFVNYSKEKVSKIKIIIDSQIKSLSQLFEKCINIKKINFTKFNRKNIIDMSSIFDGCINLEEINFNNNFITDKVTDMSRMFFECSSLTKLDLSNFNTGNVINMEGMFEGCSSLKELNLTNFNTENVTSMYRMFFNCSSLVKLNLNSFNTDKVSDMSWMFHGCSSLKELNIDNFNFSNVKNISCMFPRCLRNEIEKKFDYFIIYEAFS